MCRAPSAESPKVNTQEVRRSYAHEFILWFYMGINESRTDDVYAEIWIADATKVTGSACTAFRCY